MTCPGCYEPEWLSINDWPDRRGEPKGVVSVVRFLLVNRRWPIARSYRDGFWRVGDMDGLDRWDLLYLAVRSGYSGTVFQPSERPQVLAAQIRRVACESTPHAVARDTEGAS